MRKAKHRLTRWLRSKKGRLTLAHGLGLLILVTLMGQLAGWWDVAGGLFGTVLYQNDPRWQDTTLGDGTTETIGDYGCLLTSLTMVINHFGGNETPVSFNEKMKEAGGFWNQYIKPSYVPAVFPQVTYQRYIQSPDSPAPIADIDAGLAAGSLIVVQVDYSPDPGLQGHWIVLHGKQGDDYLMWDPWKSSREVSTLTEQYGHSGTPAEIIREAMWFGAGPLAAPPVAEGEQTAETELVQNEAEELALSEAEGSAQDPAAGSETAAADASTTPFELKVKTTTEDVALRAQPALSEETLIRRLPLASEMLVVDPSDVAAKIGAYNEWIYVQVSDGTEGHVAAWYITSIDAPTPDAQGAQAAGTATSSGELLVRTTTEDVALRTQPELAEETLIERLPLASKLVVLGPDDAAQRIGAHNEWLQVQTSDGAEGYVAAWYVVSINAPTPDTQEGETADSAASVEATASTEPTGGTTTVSMVEATTDLTVETTTDGVALRSLPELSEETLIQRLPLASELVMLGPDDAAQKIGVHNEWLQVQTSGGDAGYVAAWYVSD